MKYTPWMSKSTSGIPILKKLKYGNGFYTTAFHIALISTARKLGTA